MCMVCTDRLFASLRGCACGRDNDRKGSNPAVDACDTVQCRRHATGDAHGVLVACVRS